MFWFKICLLTRLSNSQITSLVRTVLRVNFPLLCLIYLNFYKMWILQNVMQCDSVFLPVNNSFTVLRYILVSTRGAGIDISSSKSGGCGCFGEIVVSPKWCLPWRFERNSVPGIPPVQLIWCRGAGWLTCMCWSRNGRWFCWRFMNLWWYCGNSGTYGDLDVNSWTLEFGNRLCDVCLLL